MQNISVINFFRNWLFGNQARNFFRIAKRAKTYSDAMFKKVANKTAFNTIYNLALTKNINCTGKAFTTAGKRLKNNIL